MNWIACQRVPVSKGKAQEDITPRSFKVLRLYARCLFACQPGGSCICLFICAVVSYGALAL